MPGPVPRALFAMPARPPRKYQPARTVVDSSCFTVLEPKSRPRGPPQSSARAVAADPRGSAGAVGGPRPPKFAPPPKLAPPPATTADQRRKDKATSAIARSDSWSSPRENDGPPSPMLDPSPKELLRLWKAKKANKAAKAASQPSNSRNKRSRARSRNKRSPDSPRNVRLEVVPRSASPSVSPKRKSVSPKPFRPSSDSDSVSPPPKRFRPLDEMTRPEMDAEFNLLMEEEEAAKLRQKEDRKALKQALRAADDLQTCSSKFGGSSVPQAEQPSSLSPTSPVRPEEACFPAVGEPLCFAPPAEEWDVDLTTEPIFVKTTAKVIRPPKFAPMTPPPKGCVDASMTPLSAKWTSSTSSNISTTNTDNRVINVTNNYWGSAQQQEAKASFV